MVFRDAIETQGPRQEGGEIQTAKNLNTLGKEEDKMHAKKHERGRGSIKMKLRRYAELQQKKLENIQENWAVRGIDDVVPNNNEGAFAISSPKKMDDSPKKASDDSPKKTEKSDDSPKQTEKQKSPNPYQVNIAPKNENGSGMEVLHLLILKLLHCRDFVFICIYLYL